MRRRKIGWYFRLRFYPCIPLSVESIADKTLWISRRDSAVRHDGRSALSGRKLVASWTVAAFGRPPESLSTLVIRRRFLSSRRGSETFPENFGDGDVHMYWTYICMGGRGRDTRTRVPRFCWNLSEEFFVAVPFESSRHCEETKERAYHRILFRQIRRGLNWVLTRSR